MNDLEQIDVTSMDGSTALSDENGVKCSYCGCLKDGVLMFYCAQCQQWVHASMIFLVLINKKFH